MDVMKENPHVIASLFKLYFRELPEPLFTFPAYEKFISAAGYYIFCDFFVYFLMLLLI